MPIAVEVKERAEVARRLNLDAVRRLHRCDCIRPSRARE
jgi:hypothetical protein